MPASINLNATVDTTVAEVIEAIKTLYEELTEEILQRQAAELRPRHVIMTYKFTVTIADLLSEGDPLERSSWLAKTFKVGPRIATAPRF